MSVPLSNGFGRRIRCLIRDGQNGKLIGLLALADPVYNLSVRDQWIGWDQSAKKNRLTSVMDAYVLGAVPPYNFIMGGKLIAALLKSEDLTNLFNKKYKNYVGTISGESKKAKLALITVTSVFGKSSIYNRVQLSGERILYPVGYSKGWGHFQFSDKTVHCMRKLLTENSHKYASGNKFGEGPNWKFRVIRKALSMVGMSEAIGIHGIQREVFACPLAINTKKVLQGTNKQLKYDLIPTSEISEKCLNRWILPRAKKHQQYKKWNNKQIEELIMTGKYEFPECNVYNSNKAS